MIEEKLYIKKSDGSSFFDTVLESYTFSDAALSFDTKIEGSFVSPIRLQDEFTMGEYVEYQTEPSGDKTKFYLMNRPTQTRSGDISGKDKGLYRYACKFNTASVELLTMPLYSSIQRLRTFTFSGSPFDLVELIRKSLTNKWTIKIQQGYGLSTRNNGEYISFTDATISKGLETLYSNHKVSFNTQNRTIWIGKASNIVPHTFEFGKGLKSENITPKNNTIFTKVTPKGTDKNLPYPYPLLYRADYKTIVTTYNIIEKDFNGNDIIVAIPLHKNTLMPSIYRETLLKQIAFYDLNGWDYRGFDFPKVADYYIAEGNDYTTQYNPSLPLNGDYTDNEVYPSIEDMIYNNQAIDVLKSVIFDGDDIGIINTETGEVEHHCFDNDNINTETGEVEHPYFKIELHPMGFDLWASAAARKAMTFSMRSGDTIGANYKVGVSDEDYNSSFYSFYSEDVLIQIEGWKHQITNLTEYLNSPIFTDYIGELNEIDDSISYKTDNLYQLYNKWEEFRKRCNGGDSNACILADETLKEMKVIENEITELLKKRYELLRSDVAEEYNNANNQILELQNKIKTVERLSSPIFMANSPTRDYTKFPDSTTTSITISVMKDLETFGTLIPTQLQRPKGGDKFVILGIELPTSYILSAEEKLSANGIQWLKDNNYPQYEYPLKLDEGMLWGHPEIAKYISTNALLSFKVGNITKQLPIQTIVKKHLDKSITTYDIKVTDELAVSKSSVSVNTSKIEEQEQIIHDNYIKNLDYARRNNFITQKAFDGVFDSEGNNRVDRVEALTIAANAAIIGQNPNDFIIDTPNLSINNTINSVTLGQTSIHHLWIGIGDIKDWNINDIATFTLDPTLQYYVYVVAGRVNNTARWEVSNQAVKYKEIDDVFYLVAGQLINYGDGWSYVETNGMTSTIGGTITTRKTQSSNFQLTPTTFKGMMIDFLNSLIYMGKGASIITDSLTVRRPNSNEIVDIEKNIEDLGYLKDALNEDTIISGGLVLTNLVKLGFTEGEDFKVMAGIYGGNVNKLAFWSGGDQIDIFDYYNASTGEFNVPDGIRPALGVDRFDGSGYRAGGNMYWGVDGKIKISSNLSFDLGVDAITNISDLVSMAEKALPEADAGKVLVEQLSIKDGNWVANGTTLGQATGTNGDDGVTWKPSWDKTNGFTFEIDSSQTKPNFTDFNTYIEEVDTKANNALPRKELESEMKKNQRIASYIFNEWKIINSSTNYSDDLGSLIKLRGRLVLPKNGTITIIRIRPEKISGLTPSLSTMGGGLFEKIDSGYAYVGNSKVLSPDFEYEVRYVNSMSNSGQCISGAYTLKLTKITCN